MTAKIHETAIVDRSAELGDGVVVGTLPGAREGLEVTVAQAASSG